MTLGKDSTYWLLLVLAAINSTAGNLLLKKSRAGHAADTLIDQMTNPWFIGGLVFYAVNVVLFAKALDRIPVSVAYPVLAGTGFLLLSVTAAVVYSERMSSLQMMGIVAILLGIGLVAKG